MHSASLLTAQVGQASCLLTAVNASQVAQAAAIAVEQQQQQQQQQALGNSHATSRTIFLGLLVCVAGFD
jgi:hypothetical protein